MLERYFVKPQTVDRVQELSILWGVPKSEVIRRAVDQVKISVVADEVKTPLQVLEWFRKNGISDAAAAKWNKEIFAERRAWDRKRK